MKYVILANYTDKNLFSTPKHLLKFNGEEIIVRTIHLLKENGVNDVIISSNSELFDNLGVERYAPVNNKYDGTKESGYWLDAFPVEILNEPTCYLFGDVYYSEDAIKKIVNAETDSTLLICAFENHSPRYIKKWDEPLAYKVVDTELFKKHIDIVKSKRDSHWREPIVWELYRSINGQDIGTHKMTKNYMVINDESCDIDFPEDIELLKKVIEENNLEKGG